MWRLILLATIQCMFLTGGQVCLKLTMNQTGAFRFSWEFFRDLFTNLYFLLCGVCMAIASILWFYILKHFEFSAAYPMISISYIFGMLAAIFIFHENIPVTRWFGVLLIMCGVILINYQVK